MYDKFSAPKWLQDCMFYMESRWHMNEQVQWVKCKSRMKYLISDYKPAPLSLTYRRFPGCLWQTLIYGGSCGFCLTLVSGRLWWFMSDISILEISWCIFLTLVSIRGGSGEFCFTLLSRKICSFQCDIIIYEAPMVYF